MLLLAILYGFALKPSPDDKGLESFKWLLGNWKMKTKRGALVESWKKMSDSSFNGESYMVKNRDTIPLEKIELLCRNTAYYYIPIVNAQNDQQPVEFKISSFSHNNFIAENPEHDFPKRIVYTLIHSDSIHAVLDGGPGMP